MNNSYKKNLLITAIATLSYIASTICFNDENEMLAYVKHFLPEAPVILEAGGHFGEDSIRMKSVWPKATMHVFEPLPSSLKVMLKEVNSISGIKCYPYALTTHIGTTNFYIDTHNNGASSIGYPVEWNQDEFDKTPIQVPCITLNKWAEIYDVDHIDFMWLDMEGHELAALQHAGDILKTVKSIYTEISFVPVRIGSSSFSELTKFLESYGFVEVWHRTHGNAYGDALYIKKDLAQ
jgi:2-O-methyltransferase